LRIIHSRFAKQSRLHFQGSAAWSSACFNLLTSVIATVPVEQPTITLWVELQIKAKRYAKSFPRTSNLSKSAVSYCQAASWYSFEGYSMPAAENK